MELTYWYLFPIAIGIAWIANGAGIGGATFFSPFFILALQLEPKIAIGAALATEVFGFGSGVIAHTRARTIDWRVAILLAAAAVPAGVLGSLLARYVPADFLKFVLGIGLLLIAVAFLRHRDDAAEDAAIAAGVGVVPPSTSRTVVTRDGSTYDYELCRRHEGMWFAGIGGLFVGLISTGLGELNSYSLVMRCRIPSRIVVSTSVVVVALTALAASVTHLIDFVADAEGAIDTVLSIVMFTVPGVIIGGQLGPLLSARIDGQRLVRLLGWLFVIVGLITISEALLAG